MKIWLVPEQNVGAAIGPKELPVTIGRNLENDVQVTDRWISRRHCEISLVEADVVVVRDLNSKHGSFVNGVQVDHSLIKSGDRLTLGVSRFLIYWNANLSVDDFPHYLADEIAAENSVPI